MKRSLVIFCLMLTYGNAQSQNVGIGTNLPDSTALVEIKSKEQGFLPPRMYSAQRDNIVNPAAGLMIWCIDCREMQVYDGVTWKSTSGKAASLPDTAFVKICDQVWMGKNLNTAVYRNGDAIPQVTNPAAWGILTSGAWCWYNNDSASYAGTYGRLYNWYAVSDPRGLAPAGWHIPTDVEWTTLISCLHGDSLAGGAMKEAGLAHWLTPNAGATNSSGFTGLPGGARPPNGTSIELTANGWWWSITADGATKAWTLNLDYSTPYLFWYSDFKTTGFSVRCIKD